MTKKIKKSKPLSAKAKKKIAANAKKLVIQSAEKKRLGRNQSATEIKITEFLVSERVCFKIEWRVTTNVDGKLRVFFYDFYLPKYKLLIEFDGIHHFKEVPKYQATLKEVQESDKIKNEFARKNGYQLLRISCLDKRPFENIILEYLDKYFPVI